MSWDLAGWLDGLICVQCDGALQMAPKDGSSLHCSVCELVYPVEHGVLLLGTPDQRERLDRLARSYREARLQEGWRPLDGRMVRALPDVRPPGHPRLYWTTRSETFRAFVRRLPPSRDGALAADLGAGTGWLSLCLAKRGYRAVAVEASREPGFGLGALTDALADAPLSVLPVQADLERPPLHPGRYALVVFNASLHYAHNCAATVARAASLLRRGGILAVMDTPIAPKPRPGTGRGDRHLGRDELDSALRAAGLAVEWIPVRRGPLWWLHWLRAWRRGDPRFSFPLVLGRKEAEGLL
ncbi:MAG: hypothetical protein Kow0047_21650 [Anaerolineae bacterium]